VEVSCGCGKRAGSPAQFARPSGIRPQPRNGCRDIDRLRDGDRFAGIERLKRRKAR